MGEINEINSFEGQSINTVQGTNQVGDNVIQITRKVGEILDYTDEEKEQIDELMNEVYILDDLIKSGKSIANAMAYRKFVLSYNELDDRLKIHFEEIYKDLIINVGISKINIALDNKLPSGTYDFIGIRGQVINILKVDSGFDFGIFESEVVNEQVAFVKKG